MGTLTYIYLLSMWRYGIYDLPQAVQFLSSGKRSFAYRSLLSTLCDRSASALTSVYLLGGRTGYLLSTPSSIPISIFHHMNIELALQLLSTTAVIAVGPAVVVLLFLQKGNL